MKTPRLAVAVTVLTLALSSAAGAQVSMQSAPMPTATADNESWYVGGEPILYGGNVYHPAGAAIHFVRDEMVPTGTFGRIQIYVRTTQEPGSVIYVPLAGGVMRPYERKRTGDLAGTVGSSPPSFVLASPAEAAIEEPAHPVGSPVATRSSASSAPAPIEAVSALPAAIAPTSGSLSRSTARTSARSRARVQSVQRPAGLNSVFIQFQGARWYAAGAAVEFSADRFTRVGEHRGFPVYQEKGHPGTIYLSLVTGPGGLIAPYKTR